MKSTKMVLEKVDYRYASTRQQNSDGYANVYHKIDLSQIHV